MAAIFAAIPITQLELPPSDLKDLNASTNTHPVPGAIMLPNVGAFVLSPQTSEGKEMMITVQRPMTVHERWSEVAADKEALVALFRQNSSLFPPVVQNAVRDIPHDTLRLWPFYAVPRLDCWTSISPHGHGRVIILGDSAHGMSPRSGQGVNQAFEDVYTIAMILGRLYSATGPPPTNEQLGRALHGWQTFRQERVDHVLEVNRQMDLRRMPNMSDTQKKDIVPMGALFEELLKIDLEAAIEDCMKRAEAQP